MYAKELINEIGFKEAVKQVRIEFVDWEKRHSEHNEHTLSAGILEFIIAGLCKSKSVEDLEAIAEEVGNIYCDLKLMIDKKKGNVQ